MSHAAQFLVAVAAIIAAWRFGGAAIIRAKADRLRARADIAWVNSMVEEEDEDPPTLH